MQPKASVGEKRAREEEEEEEDAREEAEDEDDEEEEEGGDDEMNIDKMLDEAEPAEIMDLPQVLMPQLCRQYQTIAATDALRVET